MMNKTDYYAEEATLTAPPASRTQAKLYGRDFREYDDNDIESLLGKLSVDEMEELNSDFDPDNSMLPPSQRCKDQTTKSPTGPYQRENLLKHLEESAKNDPDWQEAVPYSPGLKRGKVFEPKEDTIEAIKKEDATPMPIELDIDEEDELDTMLVDAPEKDLVDLAGILGMHNVLNQGQYYNAVKGKGQDENTGFAFNNIVKAYQPRLVPDEGENDTDVEACIQQLEQGKEDLKDVNINNMKRVSKERIRSLIDAARNSKHIEQFSLSNTAIGDVEARGLIELIEESPTLKVLNVSSNYISPELLAKMLKATLKQQSLIEFRADNQRQSILGHQIEMDMMMSVEENETILRVGVSFQSMEARNRVAEALERNYERLRLKRLGKLPN
uniref:Tropomodulin n=1 Tax=Panagrolaimus sp. JU765 TaxID=591449 RepID=A0AC34QUG7_9BILA